MNDLLVSRDVQNSSPSIVVKVVLMMLKSLASSKKEVESFALSI